MKKYTPSVQTNNNLKNEIAEELNAIIFKLEKGKYNKNLDSSAVAGIVAQLREDYETLTNAIGNGKEDINNIYTKTKKYIEALKQEIEQTLTTKLEKAVEDLSFTVNMWTEVLNGNLVDVDADETKVKLSWSKKRLNVKLQELRLIKLDYQKNEQRIEGDIKGIEKELAELENKMVAEENERIINELYRQITAAKSKIDALNIRRGNYSVCFNLIDMIDVNINEIVMAGEYATSELNKAKGMLNMGRIRETAVNPEKAIPILRVLQDDLNKINEKVKSVDNKIFGRVEGQATITNDAMNYKEELMRKKREKEQLANAMSEMDTKLANPTVAAEPKKATTEDFLKALDDLNGGEDK